MQATIASLTFLVTKNLVKMVEFARTSRFIRIIFVIARVIIRIIIVKRLFLVQRILVKTMELA